MILIMFIFYIFPAKPNNDKNGFIFEKCIIILKRGVLNIAYFNASMQP